MSAPPGSKEIRIVYSSESLPEPRAGTVLVCGFPGSGYVGKLAVDHLIQELRANHLADIYSSSFPPQVMIRTDGTADLMKNTLFWWRDSQSSLLLLTGDSQPSNPESEYGLAEEILNLAMRFGTDKVFTLAAYITGVFVEKPRVFGTATEPEIVKSFASQDVTSMDGGSITGMNGLMLGIAKLSKLQGICLLGETSGYVVDAKASKSVLETLTRILGIRIDMANLDKRAQDTELLIHTIEQQMASGGPRGQLAGQPQERPPRDTGYIA